jgi:membrane-associated phospholipid phosphatase
MIILFYTGRFLGVINPVMGPAFFKPEFYTYLDGSVTDSAMQKVAEIMAISPDIAKEESGVMLGGVSAMPSLHMGMVSLTAFWLAIAKPITLSVTIPWVLMVWTSTVVLGWHYILDGAGGIVLALICVLLTQWILLAYGITQSKSAPVEVATT